ncbi:MAG: orotidine-5'-phosphate decarboxylase [bacterium]
MNYKQKLQNIILKNRSNLIIGLDSDLEKIPSFFLKYNNPVGEFNKAIIDSTKDIVAGFKFNIAFYEFLLSDGISAMEESLSAIPKEMIKICDAKRGDIENTAELYAKTYFDKYDFHSITISPYLGKDSFEPFLKRTNKAVYILALTSNPGGKDFQFLKVGEKYLYEIIIEKSLSWNKNDNIGFVFGANHISELNIFTTRHPDVPLLIPGIGAQSNDLENLMKNIHTKNFLINSSRSIIYSAPKDCSEKEFMERVRESAVLLNNDINSFRIF